MCAFSYRQKALIHIGTVLVTLMRILSVFLWKMKIPKGEMLNRVSRRKLDDIRFTADGNFPTTCKPGSVLVIALQHFT